jgi:hypothetical protein
VVLSQGKTRKGLFLRKALDQSKDFSVDNRLVRMLQVRWVFRETKETPDHLFDDEFTM